jgi:hypothetical protein
MSNGLKTLVILFLAVFSTSSVGMTWKPWRVCLQALVGEKWIGRPAPANEPIFDEFKEPISESLVAESTEPEKFVSGPSDTAEAILAVTSPPVVVKRQGEMILLAKEPVALPFRGKLAEFFRQNAGDVQKKEAFERRAISFARNDERQENHVGMTYADPNRRFLTKMKTSVPRQKSQAGRLLIASKEFPSKPESRYAISVYAELDRPLGGFKNWDVFFAALAESPLDKWGEPFPRLLVGQNMRIPLPEEGETSFTSATSRLSHATKHAKEFPSLSDLSNPEFEYERLAINFANKHQPETLSMAIRGINGKILIQKIDLVTGEFIVALKEDATSLAQIVTYFRVFDLQQAQTFLKLRFSPTLLNNPNLNEYEKIDSNVFEVKNRLEYFLTYVLLIEKEIIYGVTPP